MTTDPHVEALRLNAAPTRSPSDSVVNSLLTHILGGTMSAGDRLPPERKLVEILGVGRSAVREAMAALEVLGVVETRAGSGTYLRSSSSELLPRTLSWGMLMNRQSTQQLAVVRAALERAAAEVAAQAADSEDVVRLMDSVEEQGEARGDVVRYVDADMAFHQHLAVIAGNPILEDLLSTSRSLLRVWFDNAVDSAADMDAAVEEHLAIAQAIAAGDSAAAGSAMAAHMQTATARILRTSEERAATA
ncbi:MAG: FCD domain-containing protein [Ornithinimicrobium sp.]